LNITWAIAKALVKGIRQKRAIQENIDQLKNLLKGNLAPVLKHFRDEMKEICSRSCF
jgi:hypothetical protein